MREVAVPIWYGVSNLAKLSVSEEAVYVYVSTIFTLICFAMDCYDELSNATRWALGCLVDLGEPEVSEVFVDENLYLMPAHDSWEILGADVEEVISWWKVTAAEVFGDVIDAEFWTEGVPCLEAAGSLLCLPPCKEVSASRKLVKKARR